MTTGHSTVSRAAAATGAICKGRWCSEAPNRASGMAAPVCPCSPASMPRKKNANDWHHIPKMRHALKNWAERQCALRRGGSPMLWITDEAIAA